jgi:predicted metal-dependent hydrolase
VTDPPYRVYVSPRAKYPRLKMSARDGLVVVIPRDFDKTRIPAVVEKKRDWIRSTEQRLQSQSKFLTPEPPAAFPERVSLYAIGQEWFITYRLTKGPGVTGVERPGQQLLVYGDITDVDAVTETLRRWLSRKTREHIAPWLEALARNRGFDIGKVSIRSQRKRWASCSARGTISLNLRLMFLPARLVRYALIHELVHTREMNHSRLYWAVLESLEPDYRALDEELRTGWRLVPNWIRPT